MNPNDEVNSQWVNATGTKPIDASNNDPTYGRLVTYRDGHVTLYVYKRGSGDPSQGVPDQQVGEPQQLTPDPTVKKAWDDAQKSQQAPGGISKRIVDGHWMGYNPATGNYDIDQGPANPPSAQPPHEEPNPSDPTVSRIWDPKANGGQGGWTTGVPIAQKPPTGNAQTQTIGGTTYERQPDGTWTPAKGLPQDPTKATPKYAQVKQDEATGKWFGLTPAGTWEAIEGGPGSQGAGPPVPASASGWTPDPSKPDMGLGPRRAEVAGMLSGGVFGDPASPTSVAKANDLLKGDFAVAQTVATNLGNIQQGDTNIYSGSIRQREGDQSQANARLSAANSLFNTALQEVEKLAPYQKKGSGAAYKAFQEILDRSRAFATQFGGLKDSPTIQPSANMTRTSPLFQAPAPFTAPSAPAAPGAVPAAGPAPAPAPFVPPPTGAPRTAPATQGPFAPPVAPAAPPAAPVAPGGSDYGPFDPPGYGPQQPAAPPAQTLDPNGTGPQPGDFPATPPSQPTYYPGTPGQAQAPSLSDQAARAQALIGPPPAPTDPGGTLAWAHSLGFDPSVIAAWTAMQTGQQAA